MKVLIDTSVWSLALRRRAPADPVVPVLHRLITAGRAAIVGPIRQELLSGIRDTTTFDRLREHLASFPDEPIVTADYEQAAEFYNTCRRSGFQGSNTDFLLCAVSIRQQMPLLTTDSDFSQYARLIPVALHPIQ